MSNWLLALLLTLGAGAIGALLGVALFRAHLASEGRRP